MSHGLIGANVLTVQEVRITSYSIHYTKLYDTHKIRQTVPGNGISVITSYSIHYTKLYEIITTEANEKIKPIHERMPVILPPYAWPQWTDASMEDSAELESMLKAFDGGRMDACEVSSVVNSPSNDSPDCIAPLDHKS